MSNLLNGVLSVAGGAKWGRVGCSGGAVELQSARNYVASSLKVSAPGELARKGRAEHVSWYLHSKA